MIKTLQDRVGVMVFLMNQMMNSNFAVMTHIRTSCLSHWFTPAIPLIHSHHVTMPDSKNSKDPAVCTEARLNTFGTV